MDSITRALQLARGSVLHGISKAGRAQRSNPVGDRVPIILRAVPHWETARLAEFHLRNNRVVAFDGDAIEARHFDLLRIQLQQHTKRTGVHMIAVTAPTRGCGVTVTALNLAFSFTRVPGNRVLIVDANERAPAVSNYLGLPLATGPQMVQIRQCTLGVQCLGSTSVASTKSEGLAQRHAGDFGATVIIYDLPSVMSSDLPQTALRPFDSVVLVLATGQSKVSEMASCRTFMGAREGVQVILNKCGRHGL